MAGVIPLMMGMPLELASTQTDICPRCGLLNFQLVTLEIGGERRQWRMCSTIGCHSAIPADWPVEGQDDWWKAWNEHFGPLHPV